MAQPAAQIGIALGIVLVFAMLPAVNLDDEFMSDAREVRDVAADRNLLAKLQV